MEHIKYLHKSFVWCSASISNSESLITQSYCVIAKLLLEEGRAWAGTNSPILASSNSIGRKKKYETNKCDANKYEENKYEENQYETNKYEANKYEANKYEENKYEANKYEINKYETNKY